MTGQPVNTAGYTGTVVTLTYTDVRVWCSCGWEHELGDDRDGANDIVLQHLAAEHQS